MQSTFANATPGVGAVLGAVDGANGEDSITGEKLTYFQRGLGLLAAVPFVGGMVKSTGRVAKTTRAVDKVADTIGHAPVRVTGDALAAMRKAFGAAKPQAWMDEAAANASKYTAAQLERMKKGLAPLGDDGFPMEIHHIVPLAEGGTNLFSNFQFLTRTLHRLGPNYKLNHPNLP